MTRTMKTVVLCSLVGGLLGCADTGSDYRSDAYYSEKPATVREAEAVDGRAGAYKSAPGSGSPGQLRAMRCRRPDNRRP
ncbi:hypothetical protein [Candidatus Nitrospira bockiana]